MKVGTPTPHKDMTGDTIGVGDLVASTYGRSRIGVVIRWTPKRITILNLRASHWDINRTSPSDLAKHLETGYCSHCPPQKAIIIKDRSGTMAVAIARQVIDTGE